MIQCRSIYRSEATIRYSFARYLDPLAILNVNEIFKTFSIYVYILNEGYELRAQCRERVNHYVDLISRELNLSKGCTRYSDPGHFLGMGKFMTLKT